MFPKWHALFGFVLAYIVYWFTSISIFDASLIFLSSILIDFDHYVWYAIKKKDWNLKNAYIYLKKHKNIIKPLMLFHTIEFHLFVWFLSFFWSGFFYILIGMIFHSVIDLIGLIFEKRVYTREFWLIKYLSKPYGFL